MSWGCEPGSYGHVCAAKAGAQHPTANRFTTMNRVPFVFRAAILTVALATGCGAFAVAEGKQSESTAAVVIARKLVASGDLARAVAGLAAYVSTHENELEPARYLGDLYYRRADLAAAERTYRAILRFAPRDRDTHNRLGGLYAARDRIAEAIDEFSLSLPDTSAYDHLVELHRRAGDLGAFEESMRRTAELAPGDAAAQYALGTVLRAEHRPTLAARYLERALALAPHECATLAELGSAYLDADRVNDAIGVLGRCLAREPDNYPALVNLGDAFVMIARFDEARAQFDRATRVRPSGAEAIVNIGYLEDVAGHWDTAVSSYLRAINVDPFERDAYIDLGFDYDQHRLYTLAEAAFLKGLSVAPSDGRLHYLLAATYLDQGKRDLARGEYRRATASDEPDVASAANRVLVSLQ